MKKVFVSKRQKIVIPFNFDNITLKGSSLRMFKMINNSNFDFIDIGGILDVLKKSRSRLKTKKNYKGLYLQVECENREERIGKAIEEVISFFRKNLKE